MSDYNDRRRDDSRLNRIDEMVMQLHAKINNGLSERSVSTQKRVDELHAKHEEFQKQFIAYSIESDQRASHTAAVLEALNTQINTVSAQQANWYRIVTRAIWTLALLTLGVAVWVIKHAEELSALLKPLLS